MTLTEQARAVRTRGDLVAFLETLSADLATNPEGWENADLPSFIDAMAAWSTDMETYYVHRGEHLDELTPWRILADILMAARIYE